MTYKKLFRIGVWLMLVSTLNSCAAILGNSHQTVHFDSDPSGAKLYDNGSLIGTTPADVSLIKKKDHVIEFRHDGFPSVTRVLESSAGAGWIICDVLLTGLIGVAVDAATGAWNGLESDYVKVLFEK